MTLDFIGIAFDPDSCLKRKHNNITRSDLIELYQSRFSCFSVAADQDSNTKYYLMSDNVYT